MHCVSETPVSSAAFGRRSISATLLGPTLHSSTLTLLFPLLTSWEKIQNKAKNLDQLGFLTNKFGTAAQKRRQAVDSTYAGDLRASRHWRGYCRFVLICLFFAQETKCNTHRVLILTLEG